MLQRNTTLVQCDMKYVAAHNRDAYLSPWFPGKEPRVARPMKQEIEMHEEVTRQIRDMVAVAVVPVEARAVGQESVAKAREACTNWTIAVEMAAKALEDGLLIAQSSAKAIVRKIADDAVANTKSALDAAAQLVEAKTLPEAAQLQARLLQTQMTALGEQGNALIELSLKVAKEAADKWIKAVTNAVGELTNAAA
jgi:hypothetical protein